MIGLISLIVGISLIILGQNSPHGGAIILGWGIILLGNLFWACLRIEKAWIELNLSKRNHK